MSLSAPETESAELVGVARRSPWSFRFDSMVTTGAGLFVYALSAVTGPLLARNLGPAGRGDLAAVLVPTEMVGWILCFGMPLAAVFHSRHHEDRSLVMSSWAFALVAGGALVLASWWAIPWYLRDHAPETVGWFRAFLVSVIVFAPVMTAVQLLTARGAILLFNFWKLFPLVVNSAFVVALAVTGDLTLRTAILAAFTAKVLWFAGALTSTRSWPGRGFRRLVMGRQLRYGSRVIVGSLSQLIVARLDQFLLVGLVAPRLLGFYAVAVTAVGFTAPMSEGIATILFPRLLQSRGEERRQTLRRAVEWTFAASVLCSAGIGLLAPWVLPALFGEAFRSSLAPLWILLPGQCAANVGRVIASKLLADNRPGTASAALGVAAAITVVGLLVTVDRYGIHGAAAVTTASQVVYLAYVALAVRSRPKHREASALVASKSANREVPDD